MQHLVGEGTDHECTLVAGDVIYVLFFVSIQTAVLDIGIGLHARQDLPSE